MLSRHDRAIKPSIFWGCKETLASGLGSTTDSDGVVGGAESDQSHKVVFIILRRESHGDY